MPIPNELITDDIQGEQYYKEYLEKIAEHQRYLAEEEGTPVTQPAATQQPKPKPAPAKSQEKKRKLVTETSDKPSPAKSSKPGLVTKRCKPTRSLSLVDAFVDEEANMQRAVEESLKNVHDAHRDTLPPVEVPPVVKVRAQDEGQAGPNLDLLTEGQARSNPDTSAIPPMTTPVIDLTSRPDSPNVHWLLQATATETTTTTTTTHPPPPQPQQSTTDSILIKHISELEQIMANLIQDNKHLEERLDSYGSRLYTLENLDIPQQKKRHDSLKTPLGSPPHQPPPPLPPVGPSGTSGSLRASRLSQLPLPLPPLSTSQSDQSKSTAASSSSKTAALAKYIA
nr:hypothetical protein [Tanacetum cinerariifolium]